MFEIHNMDCIFAMQQMADNSVDSIVTDPPYELGFMGKAWDASGIANSVEMWTEALRVLKPGGHLLAFSGSRTYHRMTCAIEDAGFEVRDQIMWVYGSGFPKSLDVSKAIAKMAQVEEHWEEQPDGTMIPVDPSEIIAYRTKVWEGWGTALKPAHEPICVARKPLIGTVATNVLAHGTGALNIDGCRVDHDAKSAAWVKKWSGAAASQGPIAFGGIGTQLGGSDAGRWPANLIHDGSDEVIAAFPAAPGQQGRASTSDTQRAGKNVYGDMARGSEPFEPRGDAGSAARFFYCAKASKADRTEGNHHPTVKPTDLMRYLVRLITPPGGLVLDPFMGSGSTGKACMREGFRFVGCELSAEYVAIAEARIEHALWGDLV